MQLKQLNTPVSICLIDNVNGNVVINLIQPNIMQPIASFSYRLIGSVTVNLATLAQRQVLNLEEQLVDANKKITNVSAYPNS